MSGFPRIVPVGLDGLLVQFADTLTEPANRAALAFRAALDARPPEGVAETATSLTSAFVRFDPLALDHDVLEARLASLLATRDWYGAALPPGRRRFAIPTVWGTELAPQLDEAAALAGTTPEAAIAELSATPVRVMTLGFAPGQPYLGLLPERWNLPRQTALTPRVPVGALTLAIRQFVLFTVSTPTGWRHVGQTAFQGFRPEAPSPVVLRPGDEVVFPPVSPDRLEALRSDPGGGTTTEPLA